MSFQTSSWETKLLAQAQEAFENRLHGDSLVTEFEALVLPTALQRAYSHCDEITRQHSRTFYLASSLLPGEKRRAVRALYAFCRVSDDIVDRSPGDAADQLRAWQKLALGNAQGKTNPIVMAWTDTRLRFRIPLRYAEQLIEGVSNDLHQTRYTTFADLASYCYSVASTVGLMSMHIIGFSGPQAIPYAVKLGVALQLTNILRDVGEDWRAGRLYLPQDELAEFGLDERVIEAGRVTAQWRSFMRFQIRRANRLFEESMPGIQMLNSDGRFAIAAASRLYQAILEDIEEHDYDVFNWRAHLSAWEKVRRLPGIYAEVSRQRQDSR